MNSKGLGTTEFDIVLAEIAAALSVFSQVTTVAAKSICAKVLFVDVRLRLTLLRRGLGAFARWDIRSKEQDFSVLWLGNRSTPPGWDTCLVTARLVLFSF